MQVTEKLASLCSDLEYGDLPPEVVHQVKRCILDWLGVGLAAARHETTCILGDHVRRMGGAAQASILGSGEKVSVEQAALINGTMSHVHDFDDTHIETVIHPSSPIIPAACAMGEWRGLGGRECITAVAVGMEAALRIGVSVCPAHYDHGWHITGTAGVFGAAAAGCTVDGLDPADTAAALGIAATMSSGLREMFGTMSKPYLPGHAAANGVRAALLARGGFTSSKTALEGKRGWTSVFSVERDLTSICDGWGREFEVARVGFKPYPSGVVTHPPIDGILHLAEEHDLEPSDIESVQMQVHPLVDELTGKKEPATGLEGKFSVYHCVAAGLIRGQVGLAEFTDACVRDPEMVALRQRVSLEVCGDLRRDEARVTVNLTDGTSHAVHIEHARGSVERPLTDGDLQAKFLMLTAPLLGSERASIVSGMCWDLENQDLGCVLSTAVIDADKMG